MHLVAALITLALVGPIGSHSASAQSTFSDSAHLADNTVIDATDDIIQTNVYNRHGMRPTSIRRRVADITPQEHWLVDATEQLRNVAGSDPDAAAALRELAFSGALEQTILWVESHCPDAPTESSASAPFINHNHTLSALALWAGDLDRAEDACTRILTHAPDNTEARMRMAHITLARRDLQSAAQQYEALAKDAPAVARFNQAMTQRQLGNTREAAALLTSDQAFEITDSELAARYAEERALAHIARGDFQNAEHALESAQQLYTSNDDQLGLAECAMHLASIARERGQTRQAEMKFDQALRSFQLIGATRRTAWAQHDLALLQAQRGELSSAINLLEHARGVSRRCNDVEGVAAHFTAIAQIHTQLQQWTKADFSLTQAEQLTQSIHWQAGIARAKHTRGTLLTGLNQFDKAATAFHEAVNIENALGHARHAAFSALALAHARSTQGHHDAAIQIVNGALELLEERNITRDVADAFLARADVRRRAGSTHDALDDYAKAIALFEQHANIVGLATASARYGEALLVQGRLDDAETALRRALTLDRPMNRKLSVAWTLNDLAELAWLREDYSDEEVLRREAWEVVQQLTDQYATAEVALGLGAMAHRRRTFSEAVEWYDRARRILEEREPTANLAAIYGNLGLIAHRNREYDQAETLFRAGTRVADAINAKEHQAFLQRCIGDLLRSRNANEEAIEVLTEALRLHTQLNDVRGMYEDARSLGHALHRLKRWPETEAAFHRSLDLARQLDHNRWTIEALVNLGDAAFDADDRDSANDWWIQARDLAHEVRADWALERIRERLGRR